MITDIKKILCVIFLTFFCFSCNSKDSGKVSSSNSDSIKKGKNLQKKNDLISFVESFYKTYSTYGMGNNNENKLRDFIFANGSEYLTQNLKLLVLKDIKCAEKGYVCNLDMDPFYNSQDKIILSSVLKENDTSVEVVFDNKSKLKIIFDCNGKCLISNILYPNDSNLEEILKQKD